MNGLFHHLETNLAGIPCRTVSPAGAREPLPVAVYYHGWSGSAAEKVFTGQCLAASGYLVVLPDAPLHGRRGSLPYGEAGVFRDHFWNIVLQAADEAGALLDAAARLPAADPERLAVLGVSMGGMIASGVFASQSAVRCLVNINGACDWPATARSFAANEAYAPLDPALLERLQVKNPAGDLQRWVPRPVLLLHGEADTTVPFTLQHEFLTRAVPAYAAWPERLELVPFPKLDHFTTVSMLELAAGWLAKFV